MGIAKKELSQRRPPHEVKVSTVIGVSLVLLMGGTIYATSHTTVPWIMPLRLAIGKILFWGQIGQGAEKEVSTLVDSLFHIVGYGILTMGLLSALGNLLNDPLKYACVVVILILVGGTDELHQRLIPGRDASVLDFACDLLGMFWAFTFYVLLKSFARVRFWKNQI